MTNHYLSFRKGIILLIVLSFILFFTTLSNAHATDASELAPFDETDIVEEVTAESDVTSEENEIVTLPDETKVEEPTQNDEQTVEPDDDPYAELQETYKQSQLFTLSEITSDYQSVNMDDYVVDVIPYYDTYQEVIVNSRLNETDNKGRGTINPYLKKIVIPDTIDISDFGTVNLTINFKDYQTGSLLKACQYDIALSDVINELNLFKKDNHYYILNTDTQWEDIMMTYSNSWDYDEIMTMIDGAPIYHDIYRQSSPDLYYNRIYYHVDNSHTYTTPSKLFENAIAHETIEAQGTGRLALAAVGHYWSDDDPDNYVYAYDYDDFDVIGKMIYLYEEGDEEDPIYCLYKGTDLVHKSDVTDLYEYYSYGSNSYTLHDYGFFTVWLDANLNLKANIDIMVDRTSTLTLEKHLENHEVDDELYEFRIRFYKEDGSLWQGQVDINDIPEGTSVTGLHTYDEGLVSIYNYLTVKMPADTSLTLKNIPVGLTYAIEEVASDDFTVLASNETGAIDSDGETASFTNVYSQPHDLSLIKQVTGNLGDRKAYFAFNVTVSQLKPDTTYTVDLSQCDRDNDYPNPSSLHTDDNGSMSTTLYLKDEQTITFKDLPDSAHYGITEQASDYTVSYSTSSGDTGSNACIGDLNDDLTITFTNNREGVIPTDETSSHSTEVLIGLSCALIILRRLRLRHG